MRRRHHLAVSAYWFATNLHWGALLMVMMPSQVKHAIAPTWPAPALSIILGAGAMVALVTPPLVGAFSDRCASRWGRRRPYMVAGVAVNVLGLAVMWAAGNLASVGRGPTPGQYTLAGYATIFALAAFFLLLGALLLRNVRGVR